MQDTTRIVVLSRLRVVLTGGLGPEDPYAYPQAVAVVMLGAAARRYRIAGADHVLDHGHILLVNPMTAHHAIASATQGGQVLSVSMAPEFVGERVAALRGVAAARPFGVARAPLSAALRGRAERLAALVVAPGAADAAIAAAAADFAADVLDAHAAPVDSGGPAFDYRIRRAIQAVSGDPSRPATVDGMLAASELSRSRFFQLFRECTGLTPQMYIDAHALEATIDALTRTDAPIADVARALGFGAAERFARYVKRMTGLGPRDLRRAAIRI